MDATKCIVNICVCVRICLIDFAVIFINIFISRTNSCINIKRKKRILLTDEY